MASSCRNRPLSLHCSSSIAFSAEARAARSACQRWKCVSNRFSRFDGKFSHRTEALRVPHWLPALVFAPTIGAAAHCRRTPNDFVFDNQILAQIIALECAIGKLTCLLLVTLCRKASSINFPPKRALRIRLPGNSCPFSFGTLGSLGRSRSFKNGSRRAIIQIAGIPATSRRSDRCFRSISASDDVMAMDPDSLPIPRCPMSLFSRRNRCGPGNNHLRERNKADRRPPR